MSYSQIENSKRKIELLPPTSAAIKKLDIIPRNPNYFSIKKKEESKSSSKRLDKKETFLNPGDIYLKKLNREEKKKPNNYNKGEQLIMITAAGSERPFTSPGYLRRPAGDRTRFHPPIRLIRTR